MNSPVILTPTVWTEYELLDSGNGGKLERFGSYTVVRPDPRALWLPSLSEDAWSRANASYLRTDPKTGKWQTHTPPPDPWHIHYKDLTFILRPTEFKHVGIFPEQATNWDWIQQTTRGNAPKVLNLFAYTGGATLAAAKMGAQVTHVDSVKSTVTWAHDNAIISGLKDAPIRWIEDDAFKFVAREAKRGNVYDAIIMDPPRFGHGSKGEIWKIATDLPKFLSLCKSILSPRPLFFLINAYTTDISAIAIHSLLEQTMGNSTGVFEFGELALQESTSKRLLPSGIFARWARE